MSTIIYSETDACSDHRSAAWLISPMLPLVPFPTRPFPKLHLQRRMLDAQVEQFVAEASFLTFPIPLPETLR